MSNLLLMLLALVLAAIVGYIALKIKFPGGLLVGAVVVFATLQVMTGHLWVPSGLKELAQIVAGSFTGASLTLHDIRRSPKLWRALLIILLGLIALNIAMGLIIYSTTDLSLVTALFATIPGGLNTIPLISSDYGADSTVVAVMQFARMIMGIGVFPSVVLYLSQKKVFQSRSLTTISSLEEVPSLPPYPVSTTKRLKGNYALLLTIISSFIVHQWLNGLNLMVIALIITALLNLTIGISDISPFFRRIAQFCAGWYIGVQFYPNQFSLLLTLIKPILIVIPLFLLGCLILGWCVHKLQPMPLSDSWLAAIPAGASDVVLILTDLHISNTDIVVIQVLRVIVVTSLFPEIISFISQLFH